MPGVHRVLVGALVTLAIIPINVPINVFRPANASNGMFMILRGLEGDPKPLAVGSIALPPTVPWNLRLRKFTTRLNHVQPLAFVDFVNYTSATAAAESGGALLMTVLVLNPGPGNLLQGGATEGCFRAYTERTGPNSEWPGVLLATGTEVCWPSPAPTYLPTYLSPPTTPTHPHTHTALFGRPFVTRPHRPPSSPLFGPTHGPTHAVSNPVACRWPTVAPRFGSPPSGLL